MINITRNNTAEEAYLDSYDIEITALDKDGFYAIKAVLEALSIKAQLNFDVLGSDISVKGANFKTTEAIRLVAQLSFDYVSTYNELWKYT